MGKISHVPHTYPVVPKPVLTSLFQQDDLTEQRRTAYKLLMECNDIYREYFETGKHPLITPDFVRWAIAHTDHTTLLSNRSEDRAWMERIAEEAMTPIPMKAVCAYFDKLGPVVDHYKNNPQQRIAFVSNFPHGTLSPEASAALIEKNIKTLRDLGCQNPIDVDTVVNYQAWMEGRLDDAEAAFRAESESCRKMGATWKAILKVSVHAYENKNAAYGGDFFKSVYDMTQLAMKYGGNPKTSTGQAAAPPFNDFVSKDIGNIAAALPMIIALRDYNAAHGTNLWPKFSGGNESEADVAVLYHAVKTLAPDILDKMVIGANYRLRKNLLTCLANMGESIDPGYLMPYGFNPSGLPGYRRGLPDPRPVVLDGVKAPKAEPGPEPL